MRHPLLLKPRRALPLLFRTARWYASYLRSRPRPMACGCYITTRCNFACSFCEIRKHPGSPTLGREEILRLARELGNLSCAYFSISGGEPLLLPYAEEALAAARAGGVLYTHLVTNGFLLDRSRAASLRAAGVDEVSISIDGSPAFHDAIRGKPGAHAGALQAVEALRAAAPATAVVLNAVVMPDRPEEALSVLRLAGEAGVKMKIQPRNSHPAFDGAAGERSAPPPDPARIEAVFRELARSRRVINSDRFLRAAAEFLVRGRTDVFASRPCLFGYHHLEVWPDGTVFPCLEGMGWRSPFRLRDWPGVMATPEYRRTLASLAGCARCRTTCYVCYLETRLSFPPGNLLRHRR